MMLETKNRKEVSMSNQTVAGEEFLDSLSHYGVKGMKWGVRKDRPTTAVSTESKTTSRGKAKAKAEGGERHPASADARKVAGSKQKLKKSGMDSLSNQEIKDLNERMNLEVNLTRLDKETKSGGQKFVTKLFEPPKPREVRQLILNKSKKK
jgi:hypothetical protein